MDNNLRNAGIAVAILVILGIALMFTGTSSANTGNINVGIRLTDPPQVPAGTTALNITYSGIEVHANKGAGWFNVPNTGVLDLLSLVNFSQLLGTVSLPNGSAIDLVRFNVTSGTITINNTVYSLTIPSGRVQTSVESSALNNSSSILLELNPTVASIFTNNATIFVLVPSLRGVVLGSAGNANATQERQRLTVREHDALDSVKANISIVNATISTANNSTTIKVFVKNNENTSALIKGMLIFGNFSTKSNNTALAMAQAKVLGELKNHMIEDNACFNASTISEINASILSINSTIRNESSHRRIVEQEKFDQSGDVHVGVNTSLNVTGGFNQSSNQSANATVTSGDRQHANQTENSSNSSDGEQHGNVTSSSGQEVHSSDISEFNSHQFGNVNISINTSACNTFNVQEAIAHAKQQMQEYQSHLQEQQSSLRMLTIQIGANGTLSIPSASEDFADNARGMNMSAGQTVELTFSGSLDTAQGHMILAFAQGGAYSIRIVGEEGAHAQMNVTAG